MHLKNKKKLADIQPSKRGWYTPSPLLQIPDKKEREKENTKINYGGTAHCIKLYFNEYEMCNLFYNVI